MSCSTLPTICDTSVSETSHVSWPSTMTEPKKVPVKWWGTAPDRQAASVDLPAPEGPMMPIKSPLFTPSEMWVSACSVCVP